MEQRRGVSIKLESMQDGTTYTHHYSGEWFRKERSIYIRYIEQAGKADSEEEGIRTLIRYRPGEMSIARRGAIDSEQLFSVGQRLTGSYKSAMTAFSMETDTSMLALRSADGELPASLPFTLEWKYKLYVDEQLAGRFHIRLYIQEEIQ